MEQQVGTCGRCGGPMMAFTGAWGCVLPPPPPKCAWCGGVAAVGPVMPVVTPKVRKSMVAIRARLAMGGEVGGES